MAMLGSVAGGPPPRPPRTEIRPPVAAGPPPPLLLRPPQLQPRPQSPNAGHPGEGPAAHRPAGLGGRGNGCGAPAATTDDAAAAAGGGHSSGLDGCGR